jgi:hypothetical protein
MKFKRINYLDKPIWLFRTHFFEIKLRYQYDFGGPDMTGVPLPDLSAYVELGDFSVRVEDIAFDGFYDVTISGRFYQPGDNSFNLVLYTPSVTLPNGDDFISDTVTFDVRREYFWSGNKIRIPLESYVPESPEPVSLFAETSYQSGEFVEIASINIQDIQDDNGYYVEVNEYLDAWMGRDGWKDFNSIFTLSEDQNEYRYSIRRFHIQNRASKVLESEIYFERPFPHFVVVHGRQDPSAFFQTQEDWRIGGCMSWRPLLFITPIGNRADLKLPYSALDTNYNKSIEAPSEDTDGDRTFSFIPNFGQTVVQVVHTTLYIFLLVEDGGDTRIFYSEKESIFFRGIHLFKNMQAKYLLATENITDIPSLWLFFVDQNGELVTWNFSCAIYTKLDPATLVTSRIKLRITGEQLEWRAVCMNFGGTRPAATFGVVGNDETFFLYLSGANHEVPDTAFSIVKANVIVCGNNNSSFAAATDGASVFYTTDSGATFNEITGLAASEMKRFYRISNTKFVLISVVANTIYGTTINVFGDQSFTEIDNYIEAFEDAVLDGETVIALIGGGVNNYTAFNFSSSPTWEAELAFSDFAGKVSNRILLKSPGVINVLDINTNNWIPVNSLEATAATLLMYPAFYCKMLENAAADEPYTLQIDYDDSAKLLKYNYNGQHYRNQRALYFKNQAGAYELLSFLGQGGTMLTSKKQLSSRYVDRGRSFEAGEDFTAWVTDATEKLILNSGWLTKAQYSYFLNELNLSKEGFLLDVGSEPVPVNFTVTKPKEIADDPDLYFIELSITKAWNKI